MRPRPRRTPRIGVDRAGRITLALPSEGRGFGSSRPLHRASSKALFQPRSVVLRTSFTRSSMAVRPALARVSDGGRREIGQTLDLFGDA